MNGEQGPLRLLSKMPEKEAEDLANEVALHEPEGRRTSVDTDELVPVPDDFESRSVSTIGSKEAMVNENRDVWGNKVEFLMASISCAVGLGNVWRFPFTAFSNGGGAFLIPYIIILLVIGKPLYFLELQIGQFSSRGPLGIWDMAPILRGVGVAVLSIATFTSIYYVSILSYCVYYMYLCFMDPLPWSKCDYKMTDPIIRDSVFKDINCTDSKNLSLATITYFENKTGPPVQKLVTASELYFRYRATKSFDNLDNGMGTPLIGLAFSLLAIWIIVFLNMMLGTKTSGKGAYFTALFPYLVLFIFLVIVLLKDGAVDGVILFLSPKWENVLDANVWFKAMTQAFFSLGVGYGNIISYGSYNPFRQTPWTETIIVAFMDLFTSLLAGLIVFASIGVVAHEQGASNVKEVVGDGGPGLVFVSYPYLLSRIGNTPGPQILGVLFFLMFMALGVGSSSGYIQVVVGAIYDNFPILGSKKSYKVATVAVVCVNMYLAGLVFCTNTGWYMINFIEHYSSDFIVFVVVTLELFGISYIYGFKSFSQDLKFMYNIKSSGCNIVCRVFTIWGYVAPFFLLFVLIYSLSGYKPPKIGFLTKKWDYPPGYMIFGWILFSSIVLLIPIFAVITVIKRKPKTWRKKLAASLRPNSKWGPKDATDRENWIDYRRENDPSTAVYRATLGRVFKNESWTPFLITPTPSRLIHGSGSASKATIVRAEGVGDQSQASWKSSGPAPLKEE